jgi:hypothetical protein
MSINHDYDFFTIGTRVHFFNNDYIIEQKFIKDELCLFKVKNTKTNSSEIMSYNTFIKYLTRDEKALERI